MGDKKAKARVSRWAAMVTHASIESVAYLWTVQGFRMFLAANSLALCYYLGPSRSASLALKCALVCAAGKFVQIVITSSPSKYEEDGKELTSIWDYDPPGDVASTGAWVVLRELATTLDSANEKFPELKNIQTLPAHEMAVRLCFLFDHYDKHPLCEDISGEGVGEEQLQHLGRMLYLADQAYEGESERVLSGRLAKLGYALAHVKLTSTWAEHCPAYYVALDLENKDMLIAVRGTAQIEDVVTDLTALPAEFGHSGHLVHSGMLAAAQWLDERLSCIALGLHEAGFGISVVGHSLGAGAAALLSLMLKDKGVERLRCCAFACPPCADEALAARAKGCVLSVAFRDDVVCRFSPQSLAALNAELREFDLEAAKQQPDLRPGLQAVLHIAGAVEAVQNMRLPGFGGDAEEGEAAGEDGAESSEHKARTGEEKRRAMKESEEQLQQYQPRIPGNVLLVYRRKEGGLGRVGTDGGCAALQRISLSTSMIDDHLTASYYEALGQENLTLKTFVEEGKVKPEKAGQKPQEAGQEPGADRGKDSGEKGEEQAEAAEDAAGGDGEQHEEGGGGDGEVAQAAGES